jgi:hypothetical protein
MRVPAQVEHLEAVVVPVVAQRIDPSLPFFLPRYGGAGEDDDGFVSVRHKLVIESLVHRLRVACPVWSVNQSAFAPCVWRACVVESESLGEV